MGGGTVDFVPPVDCHCRLRGRVSQWVLLQNARVWRPAGGDRDWGRVATISATCRVKGTGDQSVFGMPGAILTLEHVLA